MNSVAVKGVFFVLMLLLSFLINWLLLRFSRNLGVRGQQNQDQVRWSSDVKPSLGGLSFFLIFLITAAFVGYIPDDNISLISNHSLIGLVAATTLGFIIGLADDSYNTNPLVKFIGQLTCAFILIFSNIYIQATGIISVDYFITILWVVGLMNSINMLDNMDGITASTSLVIILFTLLLLPNTNFTHDPIKILMIGVAGAIVGFLFFNWNPAKMYMGDTGSQFLGVFLAGISILFLWNERNSTSGIIQLKQFVLPLLLFTVPLMDTMTVFIRRLLRKQSPFVGGKDHTTHQLVFFGLTERQVAISFIFMGALSGIFALALKMEWIPWNFTSTILAFVYFFVIFGLMQIIYNIGKKKHETT